jgi:hypothetical protein
VGWRVQRRLPRRGRAQAGDRRPLYEERGGSGAPVRGREQRHGTSRARQAAQVPRVRSDGRFRGDEPRVPVPRRRAARLARELLGDGPQRARPPRVHSSSIGRIPTPASPSSSGS